MREREKTWIHPLKINSCIFICCLQFHLVHFSYTSLLNCFSSCFLPNSHCSAVTMQSETSPCPCTCNVLALPWQRCVTFAQLLSFNLCTLRGHSLHYDA